MVPQQQFKDKLLCVISQNIHCETLDNVFLARQLCMSEASFYRAVKKSFNLSPNQLIRRQRLCRAESILTNSTATSVREAAYSVGFSHVGYFIRRYEEFFGHRPGERVSTSIC